MSYCFMVSKSHIAHWSNPIKAADAKKLSVIMKICIVWSNNCLNLDKMTALFSSILLLLKGGSYAKNGSVSFFAILFKLWRNTNFNIFEKIYNRSFLTFAERVSQKGIACLPLFYEEHKSLHIFPDWTF